MCFAKVIIIKIVSWKRRVAAYLSSRYWCVYSAECRVKLSHCALCTVRLSHCGLCTMRQYNLRYENTKFLLYVYTNFLHIYIYIYIYRVSQEECASLREGVPYVKVYRYNPKHLYPKLNGYGDNGQRKVRASCGSKYCNLHSWCVTRERWWPWEWNAVLIVPAWRSVACTGVGSAM